MNDLLKQAQKWLSELNIRTEFSYSVLKVNRDDMVNISKGTWESQYDEVLEALRKELNTNKIFWGGKDDDWLFLDCY
jgi:hypothetical protein